MGAREGGGAKRELATRSSGRGRRQTPFLAVRPAAEAHLALTDRVRPVDPEKTLEVRASERPRRPRMPRRERRLSSRSSTPRRSGRVRDIAARRSDFAAPRPAPPPSGSARRFWKCRTRSPNVVLALAHHRVRFGSSPCVDGDEMRAFATTSAVRGRRAVARGGHRATPERELDREERRATRRRSAPARRAAVVLDGSSSAVAARRGLTFADVIALMYLYVHAPRARRAGGAADAALNATGSTPRVRKRRRRDRRDTLPARGRGRERGAGRGGVPRGARAVRVRR